MAKPGAVRKNMSTKDFTVPPALQPFIDGIKALIHGVRSSINSIEIRASYKDFAAHFAVITLSSYVIVSATFLTIFPLIFMILLGPCLGAIVLTASCFIICITLFIMWIFGKFPTSLFTGRFGLLRPFISVPQLSFLIATMVIPMECEQFFLNGLDACYPNDTAVRMKIREEYTKPSWKDTVPLAIRNAIFGVSCKIAFVFLSIFLPRPIKTCLDGALSAFLLGSQVTSVYTVRIRKMEYKDHLAWCGRNALKVLGFSLPLYIVQAMFGFLGTILWLGLGYSSAAALVEDLVLGPPPLVATAKLSRPVVN